MNLKKKLEAISLNHQLDKLSKDDLMKVVGGLSAVPGSCGQTASSNQCDNTRMCNCAPPPPPRPKN